MGYGNEGRLVAVQRFTNVEARGLRPSERSIVRAAGHCALGAEARDLCRAFASSIHRIQQIIDIAARVGRKVAFVGRSSRCDSTW